MFNYLILLFWALAICMHTAPASAADEGDAGTVRTVRLAATINPVVSGFVVRELERANALQEVAFLLELDTPGGLDSAMREIIQAQLASRVPVIVYVYPSGGRAASAGALITLAADFAVMAPGTNLGAAHPVALGAGGGSGESADDTPSVMEAKALNDAVAYARSIAEQRGRNVDWAERAVRESVSTAASEALRLGVVDLVADNESALLEGLEGRSYRRDDGRHVFRSAGAHLLYAEMGWQEKILNTLSHPNIAYLLLMLGILGIFFEISQPGVILPGAIGAMALLLALFAFQALPINYAGVLLILLGVVLFVLEIKVVSYGMLSVGGILALFLGSMMLIGSDEPSLQISLVLITAMVSSVAGLMLLVLFFVVRTQRRRFVSGREGMVGEQGVAVNDFQVHGTVHVHGEYWNAASEVEVHSGEEVEVLEVARDMTLKVRPLTSRKPPWDNPEQGETT